MKKLSGQLYKLLFSGAILFGLLSCQKNDITGSDGVEENALAMQASGEISDIISDAYYSEGSSMSGYRVSGDQEDAVILNGCAVITRDTVSSPHVIIVDFGTENCLCRDGRYRRGKIIATFTGPYRADGTVITHTTEDYFVNDNKVDAKKTVTNLGRNDRGNLHYEVHIQSTITLANGNGEIMHEAHRNREWIIGETTRELHDDVYLLRGNGHTITANGVTCHTEIISPLRKEIGFRFIVAGIEKITRSGDETRVFTMDFGYPNGERDDLGLVTFGNGETRVVRLR